MARINVGSILEEGWETTRSEHVRNALEAMSAICKNENIDPKQRIEAARTIDAISDSILKVYMLDGTVEAASQAADRGTKKISDQIDKLRGNDDEGR